MNGPLILIVDDDADTRILVQSVLISQGFTVETAAGGQEALNKLKEGLKPAMMIVDIMMPEMSGYDLIVHLKQRPETQNIPLMMLTAKDQPEDLIRGYKDYGVEYYITKPFTTRQLVAGIKLILGEDQDKK